MMYLPLLSELTLILSAGLIGGIIAKKLKFPVVTGYLLVGGLFSFLFHKGLASNEAVVVLADIGIALLLFSVGLEFSLDKFSKAVRPAMLGALVQVLLTTLIGFFVFPRLLQLSTLDSLILAFVVSMSSTSVVIKILTDT